MIILRKKIKKICIFILPLILLMSTDSFADNQMENTFNKGEKNLAAKNYDGAIAEFTKVIKINPAIDSAYVNRAIACYHKGNYDQVIMDCSHAINLNPTSELAFYYRGKAYFAKGDYIQAETDLSRAISLNPKSIPGYSSRAELNFELKKYGQAWKDLFKANKLGYTPDPELIRKLEAASGKKELIGGEDEDL